jgi:large repetitive protein
MASQLNVRSAHRRSPRAPRWAFLRVALAIALAVLMLPFLGSSASAEEGLEEPAETVEVLQTGSAEELIGDAEQPPAEEAAEPPAEEQADPPQKAAEPEVLESEEAEAPGIRSGEREGGNLLAAVDETVEPLIVALATPIAESELATATYAPADEQGANDEPGQKDLTKLWLWPLSGSTLKVGWNWDDTAWSGNNTGDACALFDVDDDTFADFAVCVTVDGNPATQVDDSPRVYTCTPEKSTTKCFGATLVPNAQTTCDVDQTSTNPFDSSEDTTALCRIDLGDVGGADEAQLTNVCSYPSQIPNSDPSDCVLAPRDGKLTVKKVATPADTGQKFDFKLETNGVEELFASLAAGEEETSGVASNQVIKLREVVPPEWNLDSAVCSNGQDPSALTLTSRQHVTCTFTNSKIRYADLLVSKTATPAYDRDYDWTVDKSVDKEKQKIPEGSTATFDYSVVVTPSAPKDSSFKVSGEITVENPNSVPFTGVDVTDAVGATSCSVTGGQDATIPANGSKKFAYTCSLPGATASTTGTNTATATWDASSWFGTDGSAEGSKAFDFAAATPSVTDGSVTVTDSQYDLTEGGTKSTVVQAKDGRRTFTYSMVRGGTAGECTTYPNTATITEPDGDKLSDSRSVELCVGKDLAVTKNVVLKYDRSYAWSIGKSVDKTTKEVDPATGTATFDYKVTVEAKPYSDSSWAMSGKITVTNPNKWQDVTLSSIKDVVDVGGGASCTVQQGADLKIPKSTSREFDYACTFTSQPSYTGTNTATVEWDKALHATPSGTAAGTAAVEADKDSETSINKTVRILDDKTTPGAEIELGQVTWSEGLKKDFTYSLQLAGTPGTCVDYTNNAWIKETGQSDAQKVSVCAPADLEVEKSVTATYDRAYLWDIDKRADKNRVEVSEGDKATFGYTVEAIADGYDDRGHEIHGTITVRNTNDYKSVTVDITDSIDLAGVACTVIDGTGVVVPRSGSVTRSYTCVVPDVPEADYAKGVNKATVTWDGGKATATAEVRFALDEKIDDVVDVFDDKVTLGSDPALLGKAKWADGSTSFEYPLALGGEAGVCTDYTNTAFVDLTAGTEALLRQLVVDKVDPWASETVTVCVEAPLTVDKTAKATYKVDHHWLIDKSVDQTSVELTDGGDATFAYKVEAIPNGSSTYGYAMSGTIEVTNPNEYEAGTITAKVIDVPAVGGGAECTVAGGDSVVLAPEQSRTLDYTCSFTGKPNHSGSNTATAAWTGPDQEQRSVSDTVPVSFSAQGGKNSTVTVTDSLADPSTLGTATWNKDGTPTVFDYTLTHEGVENTCVDFTNTATIVETGQSDSETVTVCTQGDLVVAKSAEASYDRTYAWDISKVADRDRLDTLEGEPGTVNYTVGVTPTGYVDSGWEMSGAVTVHNPNVYKDVTVDLSDVPDLGGGAACVFDETEDFLVEAGQTRTFTYTCSFEEQPAYDGSNAVHVDWGTGKVSATTAVGFELDEAIDETVTVTDDLFGGELGQVTWNADGKTVDLEYALEVEGPLDACETVTNTATIVETGQEAQAEILVCGPEILPVEEEVPPAPRPPAILPETGAPYGMGLWAWLGGLMVALGAALLMWRRRDAS